MGEIKLKACPFCGSDKVHADTSWQGWFVECDGCQAQTGRISTKSHAITAWNTRTPLEVDEGMVERAARAIMLNRTFGIAPYTAECRVVDWVREYDENPHVKQAVDQARAALLAAFGGKTDAE